MFLLLISLHTTDSEISRGLHSTLPRNTLRKHSIPWKPLSAHWNIFYTDYWAFNFSSSSKKLESALVRAPSTFQLNGCSHHFQPSQHLHPCPLITWWCWWPRSRYGAGPNQLSDQTSVDMTAVHMCGGGGGGAPCKKYLTYSGRKIFWILQSFYVLSPRGRLLGIQNAASVWCVVDKTQYIYTYLILL